MAEKLGMSESQLSQLMGKNPSKPVGDRLARKIEGKFGLPTGWLDNENHDLNQDSADIAHKYQRLSADQRKAVRAILDSYKK